MVKNEHLVEQLKLKLENQIKSIDVAYDEVTLVCEPQHIVSIMFELRDEPVFAFDQLIDLCGIDYLYFGEYDWETDSSTEHGFSRGVERYEYKTVTLDRPRFAVVYHLLSTVHNQRIRVKIYMNEENLIVPSIHEVWKGVNWFEREAYDLYGILFEGHPDLRRILTDYGFIGHPFRKDFPVSGHVEMRYDARLEKVIYAPVDIVPRISVPKVIRDDNRYLSNGGDKS